MSNALLLEFLLATWQTIYMVLISGVFAVVFGLPLGVILMVTRNRNILANKYLNSFLAAITNGVRSIPFIILLVAVVPFTRLITGTSIGTTAAIVPLSIAAIPFVGRLVETALNEVAGGLIEAGLAMGATPMQTILKILIPEALPGIIDGLTLTLISLVGYSAMAGAVGGGGLGDLAIRYGYQRFEVGIMIATVLLLIFLVQIIQFFGDFLANQVSHKRH
jgi:D-methionine transport system permease protein